MAVDEKWYFTKEQLLQSPSRKSGYDVDKELSCRQQAANFIQDMGQRLQVSQLCINTAIVYMHRFYVFHSLAAFHRNAIAAAALFLAAKVEEQPRKLEHVIKVAHMCLHRENPNLDTKSELYLEQAQDLVFNENVLLQTLGFDVAIDHPHTHVVRCCHLVRASKDLAQTSYFMASNSLHLTTMCLQYKPTVVACFCIHLACKWSNWEIPRSNEGKDWFWYIDKTVTVDLLEQLTAEFLAILDKCPTKLKRKMMSMNQNNTPGFTQQSIPNDSLHFEEPRKLTGAEANKPPEGLFPVQKSSSQPSSENKPGTSASALTTSSTAQPGHAHHQKIDYREYREKKERERIEREKQQQQHQHQRDSHNMSSSNHHHHSKSGIIPGKNHSSIQSRSSSGSVSHKSYQQPPHGMQQNVHYQNMKEGRESSSQNFQSSGSTKESSSYLKQHPPHVEKDGSKDSAGFHGQYPQNSTNMQQHPGYSHSDSFISNKPQPMHPMKMMDPKYKGHHYHSSSKNSDIPQIKVDKPGAQCSSDFNKKPSDRPHEVHRKPQELERLLIPMEGSGSMNDVSKQHKLTKDSNEKHKILQTNQHVDQKLKEKLSPSKYQKLKSVQRPSSNVGYVKSEPPHFNVDGKPNSNNNSNSINITSNGNSNSSNSTNEVERVEGTPLSLKPIGVDESNKNVGALNSFQKQKSHEFGAPGSLSSSLPDPNFVKTNKTSSIFSPDSKIPPQNILSSLEKDSKKNVSTGHRSHVSDKAPSEPTKKAAVPGTGSLATLPTTTSTGSLFSPPLPKNVPSAPPRHRTSSSGSEPELIPVLTKLEETPGYENIMRERKMTLTPTNPPSPSLVEKEKKSSVSGNDKTDTSNAFLFEFGQKPNAKDSKSNDVLSNEVKSEVVTQSGSSKSVVNVKFPNEIRSDLGAVIYPTNPKSTPISKPNQGFNLTESKLSLANSVSTVNLLGIEKMVDTSISPAKQTNQFGGNPPKPSAPSLAYNSSLPTANPFGPSGTDQNDKTVADQKTNVLVSNQDSVDVDVLGYSEKKRSEKKKKKEKHKHKEKDKDKSERKKEKKKHKDKDKEKSKEKDKHKEKEKHKDKQKEKEIDVVNSETPIKITIPKDKISGSLKIKISKNCLKKDDIEPSKPNTSGELKMKISKDVFSNISTYKEDSKNDSRKRERSPKGSSDQPHSKLMKSADKKSSASSVKSNGMEGSSRNSNSHKYSVSENDSCFDISSLYDCPFDFEENGQGIIKTPDYDFEALNASEFPTECNTSPDAIEMENCDKNSHNESDSRPGGSAGEPRPGSDPAKESETCDIALPRDIITADQLPESLSPPKSPEYPEPFVEDESKTKTSARGSPAAESHSEVKRNDQETKKDRMISLENCDVLKNYKTILDSHSRRCESDKRSISPVSPEETMTTAADSSNNDDNNNNRNQTDDTTQDKTTSKGSKNSSDTENPNYYNKYFKKDNGARIRSREDKWSGKDKSRFEDRQRYYESRRYRGDFNERERRDERRYYREYREYGKDGPQYYYERKDERRFDYSDYPGGQYFNVGKTESNVANLNYDVNGNGTPTVYQSCAQNKTAQQFPAQICEPALAGSSSDMGVSYQYGYFNNYMYPPNGGYRFYGNVPFVNVSLIQQQPIPPGTGDSVVPLEPPPLPLEPPPDLPPPPETPPPPPK